MRSLSFPLSCLVLAACAFGLLAVSAEDFITLFLSLARSYGTGVLAFVAFMMPTQFTIAIIVKIYVDRGKMISQADKSAWYKAYARNYPWLNVFSATLALIVTSTSFTVYKSAVVGSGGYGFDATFIAWDRMFLAGNDAWVLTHSIFDSAAATKWLDILYHPTFLPMLIVYLLFITPIGLRPLRQTYILSYLAGFIVVGMIGANTLHSAGPVFDGVLFGDGTTFAPLTDRLQAQLAAGGGPITAYPIRQYLLSLHESGQVRVGAGISAMPSMHMVFVFLWVFPAWNLNRIFGAIVAAYAALIWVGSVHLGWHYFVDGLVSLILISFVWRVAGNITGLYRRPQVIRATT